MRIFQGLIIIVIGIVLLGGAGYWGINNNYIDPALLPVDLPLRLPPNLPFEVPFEIPGIVERAVSEEITPAVSIDTAPAEEPPEAATEQTLDNDADAPSGEQPPAPGDPEVAVITHIGSPNEITVLMSGSVLTLDPYRMASVHPGGSISSHIWDSLTRLNDDLTVEPQLAESWRIVNNFTWEFKIRSGIKFHNGEQVNASAVRFSIERARSLPNSLETFVSDVELQSAEIIDELTIQITTGQPLANLPYHLSFLEILPPQYYSENAPPQAALAPVGSGPYQVIESVEENAITLAAVSDYWQGEPAIPQIIFKTVPELNERMLMLTAQENILVTELPPLSPEPWSVPNSRLETVESTQRMFIGMNIQPTSPLSNTKVRQALNYAIDVETIIDDFLLGYGDRYSSWLNPPYANTTLEPWPHDPEKARELLAEAGYRTGITTTLAIPVGLYHQERAIGEAIATQFAEVGVVVNVESYDWPIYIRQLLSENRPSLFLLAINSHGDPLEDAKNLSNTFRFNPTNWQNELFEDSLLRATNAFDEDTRLRRLNDLQEIAYNDPPWVWLWRSHYFYAVSNSIDWTPRRDGLINLYRPAAVQGSLSQE